MKPNLIILNLTYKFHALLNLKISQAIDLEIRGSNPGAGSNLFSSKSNFKLIVQVLS